MKSGKIWFSVLAGAATSALAGVLFAPARGSKTRKKIVKRGENYSDTVMNKVDDLVDVITDKYEKMRKNASPNSNQKMGKSAKAKLRKKIIKAGKL